MEDPWPRSGGAQGWWTAALPLPLGVTGDSLPLPSEELLGWMGQDLLSRAGLCWSSAGAGVWIPGGRDLGGLRGGGGT